jgi:hypothetical protein
MLGERGHDSARQQVLLLLLLLLLLLSAVGWNAEWVPVPHESLVRALGTF